MNDYFLLSILGLYLTRFANVTPKLASTLITTLAKEGVNESNLFQAYSELFPDAPTIDPPQFLNSEKVIEKTIKLGISVIPICDPLYPSILSEIEDPPPVLYLKGNISVLESLPGLAVVGTRKATANGLLVAERIASHFANKGWVIVSGLAMGIDAAAHKGALNVHGKTIAVLAHGLDEVYPKTNKNLADQILQENGAFVSEYPVGYPARPAQFVLRNRIQIGLSAGSVIVEGEEKSGTKTQAEYCLRNRRHLFAVIPTAETSRLNLAASLPQILVEKRGANAIKSREDYDLVERLILSKRQELLKKSKV